MKRFTFAKTDDNVTELELTNKKVAYEAACEGIVLLENNGVLPLNTKRIALFGPGVKHTIKGGTGSGEVNERHSVSIYEAIKKAGFEVTTKRWIHDYDKTFAEAETVYRRQILKSVMSLGRMSYPYGRRISEEDIVNSNTDTAIYVVARQAGEAADKKLDNGDYDLSEIENENIRKLVKNYKNVILIVNSGASMALSILDEVKVSAVIFYCQQGMEGGNALVDILTGKVTPSGKLVDTWAKGYKDIPMGDQYSYLNGNTKQEFYHEGIYVGYRYFDTFKVEPRYHFGHGLSYTVFKENVKSVSLKKEKITIKLNVKNDGNYDGKEVVQVYVSCPSKNLNKEYQRLVSYAKTPLIKIGKSIEQVVEFNVSDLVSYSDELKASILEKGNYIIRVGNASNNTKAVAYIKLDKDVIFEQFEEICKLEKPVEEIEPVVRKSTEKLSDLIELELKAKDIKTSVVEYKEPVICDDKKVKQIVDSLSAKECATLCVGNVSCATDTNGFFVPGIVGATTNTLYKKGLLNLMLSDGPAGIRLYRISALSKKGKLKLVPGNLGIGLLSNLPEIFIAGKLAKKDDQRLYQNFTAFPVGTALAQTWNNELCERVGKAIGDEMSEYGISYFLGPALNIHRNPLCGRNFEYYSEDPLVSGRTAACITRGIQSHEGIYATIKHFACNNQEDNRRHSNSNVNTRALREIYLKAFEYAYKEGRAKSVMTSYNLLNGIYTANSYDLIQKVLRNEWGFDGVVMTDWVSTCIDAGDTDKAIAVGNDLIMPGGKPWVRAVYRGYKKGVISELALRRATANIVKQILESEVNKKLDVKTFE